MDAETTQNAKETVQGTSGPENSNQINVSVKKNPNFYVFLGKRYLEIHETIELHALGNAVSTSVIASENLVRYVYSFIHVLCGSPFSNSVWILWLFLLVNFPSLIETSTPLSRRSEQERSRLQDPEEIARKQSSSSPCREVQTSLRTWEDSVRSSLRMKSLLQRTQKTTLPLKKLRSLTSEECDVQSVIREQPWLSLCWNFNSAYHRRANGWTL